MASIVEKMLDGLVAVLVFALLIYVWMRLFGPIDEDEATESQDNSSPCLGCDGTR